MPFTGPMPNTACKQPVGFFNLLSSKNQHTDIFYEMVADTSTLRSNVSIGAPGPTPQFRSNQTSGQVGWIQSDAEERSQNLGVSFGSYMNSTVQETPFNQSGRNLHGESFGSAFSVGQLPPSSPLGPPMPNHNLVHLHSQ